MPRKKTFSPILLVVYICVCSHAFSDDREFTLVYGDAELTEIRTFDFENVLPGEKCIATVWFHNETNRTITFDQVRLGCKCVEASVKNDPIKPGEKTEMKFTISLNKQPSTKSQVVQARISFKNDDKRELVLQFQHVFKRLVHFPEHIHQSVLEDKLVAKKESFRVPVLVSSDVRMEELRVSSDPSLKFIKFEVLEIEKKIMLVGTFHTSEIEVGIVGGDVTISTLRSDAVASARIQIEGIGRYAVFPEKLVLNKVQDEDRFEGSVILRKRGQKADVSVSRVIGYLKEGKEQGEKISVELKQMASGIYRLKFDVPSSKIRDSREITLSINSDGKEDANIPLEFRLLK